MRKTFHSDQAPKAIGPYSQAARVGNSIFLSGQIPLDPSTQTLVEGDIATQTERVMQNLGAVLKAAGASFDDVVRCGIFLVDLNDFAKVNEVYGRYFTSAPPARSTVQVSALPKGARVEIDAVAVVGG
ncbi:MAG: RidA family protein [Myxococcaceae bacterium]